MSLDQPSKFVKHQSVTRDAFLGGRITLSQPEKGFRAGLDSVLLGAAVSRGARNLLDLGAGVGTAALVALALGRTERATLAERDETALELASRNIADNGFSERAGIVRVDVTAGGTERRAAGLPDNAHDAVIANPPFFVAGQGTLAEGDQRANARHMSGEALDQWVRCAAASASAGGEAIFVYPAEGLAGLLAAFDKRFGGVTILPLTPRPGSPASRVLLRGFKGSRTPLTLLASRPLHGADGNGFSADFDAIFRGEAALDW